MEQAQFLAIMPYISADPVNKIACMEDITEDTALQGKRTFIASGRSQKKERVHKKSRIYIYTGTADHWESNIVRQLIAAGESVRVFVVSGVIAACCHAVS